MPMERVNGTSQLSFDLGNLKTDYHKAVSGAGTHMKLEHGKTGESFLSLDFCGGAAVACLGNGGENASAEYNRVVDATAAQMKKLAYVSHTTYRSDVNFELAELLVRNANRILLLDEKTNQWHYKDIESDALSKMSHAIIVNSGKSSNKSLPGRVTDDLEAPRRPRQLSRQFGSTGVRRESQTRGKYYRAKAHTMAILWEH